ncbi:MAG: hypothetical protein RR476_08700, partial [Cetobacterium sp.]
DDYRVQQIFHSYSTTFPEDERREWSQFIKLFEHPNVKVISVLNNTENMYEKIKELYEKRKLLYKISCDYSISINKKTNVYDTVEAIKDAYILS